MAVERHEDSPLFALDAGLGNRLKVFTDSEATRVSFFDPDRDAWISIARCDWDRIVALVQGEFE